MTEFNESELTVDWFGLETDVVRMSDWTNEQDSNPQLNEGSFWSTSNNSESNLKKRSTIVHAIMYNHSLDHLRSIVGSGLNVNEILRIPDHVEITHGGGDATLARFYEKRTALGEAARQGWMDGVKTLLDAGANCKRFDGILNPLSLALKNRDCKPEIIELLLKHGADPSDYGEDFRSRPILYAVNNCTYNHKAPNIISMLLEHGANPNVTGMQKDDRSPLFAALCLTYDTFSTVFRTLVKYGADVNYHVPDCLPPILHRIMETYDSTTCHTQQLLDIVFQHGGNIHMGYQQFASSLEFAVGVGGHTNNIRWVLRHGGNTTSIRMSRLRPHLIPDEEAPFYPETPLVLLEAGMRVSHEARTQLKNMMTAMTAWLQDGTQLEGQICSRLNNIWDQLKDAEKQDSQQMQVKKTSTWPEYFSQQMIDLQSFSDQSLQFYPKEICLIGSSCQDIFDIVHKMVNFLSQVQSLQWQCRRYLREKMVSLDPSAMKTLPISAILKQYILCHEI